jgi:hypothetical protein
MPFGRSFGVEQSRRKDHKSWRDQKTLRTTGCLRVFSSPCPSCSSRVESASTPGQWLHQRQPYVRRPHRHKRILPARDSASKQPLCLARFFVVRSGLVVNCACCSCDSSAQLATRDRWAPTPHRGAPGGTARAIDLGSSTAATCRPQMRARALSADVFWASRFTTSNKP